MSIEAMKTAYADMTTGEKFGDAIDALHTAIQQAEAQQPATGVPVYWEWRHLSTHPDTVDFGKWSEWKRVEARSAIHTIDDALAEFRAYIAQGYKYELRALYDHPAPSVPADVVRDAERYRWLRASTFPKADQYPYRISTKPIRLPIGFDDQSTFDAAIDAAMLAAK